ncbi:MerR family transcriptional regulator [Nocardia zapadnayensis]|uniref:MerR family transcriptional regulator n=1 Tax=Nocardia rhamnosiphila TaxID=426716 RepID=UPI0022471084|nr:MerR family transcriptional regulator [Nocardia zapadnayensis]MCX0269237.1 MerR family transcriptional regulator [Nocardia zapadnayensis]
MVLLDIAEVANRSGLAPSALRFYERRGLIQSAGRNGLRRMFEPEILDRLTLIDCARGAGFTLAQIQRFLTATPDDTELRAQLAVKATQLDHDIARLTRMRDSLSHAVTCTHQPLVECAQFKNTLADGDHPRPAPTSAPMGVGGQAD